MSEVFRVKVFEMTGASSVLFFACPYSASIDKVRWAIKRLQKDGYLVVAYDCPDPVVESGNPAVVEEAITGIAVDIRKRIAQYQKNGIQDFGFFGSSLGAFIFYNCIARIPELKWGVFNTGGNLARGLWKLPKLRRAYQRNGFDLARLELAWQHLQHPDFKEMAGHHYVFYGSNQDLVAPLKFIHEYLEPLLKAGAQVEVMGATSVGHVSLVTRGLLNCRRLVSLVRA